MRIKVDSIHTMITEVGRGTFIGCTGAVCIVVTYEVLREADGVFQHLGTW